MSGVKSTSNPSSEAISLADAKAQMRVTHDAENYFIDELIEDVREEFEGLTGHSVMPRTWELTIDRFPVVLPLIIRLPMPPVISVESIKYLDVDGVLQTLSSSVYKLVLEDNTTAWLELKKDQSWPATIPAGDAVIVSYTAGYGDAASVPRTIKKWMKMVATDWYRNRESITDSPTGKINIDRSIMRFKDWSR